MHMGHSVNNFSIAGYSSSIGIKEESFDEISMLPYPQTYEAPLEEHEPYEMRNALRKTPTWDQ